MLNTPVNASDEVYVECFTAIVVQAGRRATSPPLQVGPKTIFLTSKGTSGGSSQHQMIGCLPKPPGKQPCSKDRNLIWRAHITGIKTKFLQKLHKVDWLRRSSKLQVSGLKQVLIGVRSLVYLQLHYLRDLQTTVIGDQINLHSSRYADRLATHPKTLASSLASPLPV